MIKIESHTSVSEFLFKKINYFNSIVTHLIAFVQISTEKAKVASIQMLRIQLPHSLARKLHTRTLPITRNLKSNLDEAQP